MTPGANGTVSTDQDHAFSQSLRTHAVCLDLQHTMPVGAWTFGQGIRRAHGNQFFWELRSQNFQPLGLNHPITLRPTNFKTEPQKFPATLSAFFPELATWQWSLVKAEHPWLQRAWQTASAWQLAPPTTSWSCELDATFKSEFGWQGFSLLKNLQGWAIHLTPEIVWIAAPTPLPDSQAECGAHWPVMQLLLQADVLSPTGRIQEVQQKLRSLFAPADIAGLNVRLETRHAAELSQRGLAGDSVPPSHLGLAFPLSFLPSELHEIAQLLKTKG